MSTPRTFTLASRASQLAQIQTNIVVSTLQSLYPESDANAPKFSTSFMATAGDKNQSQALYLVGGKSFWTKELEVALLDGEVDMLVHSLKDVPTQLPDGCVLGAILEREDPVDALVVKKGEKWKSLDELPEGSVVGTSSVRRVAQLKRNYPKLKFLDVRGNLNTRLAKLDAPDSPYAAIILAKAGILRMGPGWPERITADLAPPTLYYAVSQGALGVEIRANDAQALELCRKLTHWQTEWKCLAERQCLRVLEGGCSVPIGVFSELKEVDGQKKAVLKLTGTVTAIDASSHAEHTVEREVHSREEAEAVGSDLAKHLLTIGAKKILDDINVDRSKRVAEAEKKDKELEEAARKA